MSTMVKHYLYFPVEDVAARAAAELKSIGYRAESRRGALGDSWLVLAFSRLDPAESRVGLEKLALELGGEYDGWEAAV